MEKQGTYQAYAMETGADNGDHLTALDREIREVRAASKIAIQYRDIMARYGVGIVKARYIIREIRKTCGGGKLGAGKVLPSELEYWETHPNTTRCERL